MNYEVSKKYQSNYPNPITLSKGQYVIVGKEYSGPEGWENWIYCFTLDKKREGWVPKQIIQDKDDIGLILDNYTAKELNVEVGEKVFGLKELNGWIWCKKLSNNDDGWVPKDSLILLS